MNKINILIVEDDPIIAADLQDRLEGMGYEILGPVTTGENALHYFENNSRPDLVLMDIQLEGTLDGIETTRHIRSLSDIPVVFLTSNSDEATFEQAKKVNPQAFLSKPFRGRDLKHAIELAILQSTEKSIDLSPQQQKDDNAFVLKDRLFIKAKERMVRLFLSDILYVEADDYYCKVTTNDRQFLVTKTLKNFSEDLAENKEFMRVHRSYLVNLKHIEEIGEVYLYTAKHKIPISRQKRIELLSLLKNL